MTQKIEYDLSATAKAIVDDTGASHAVIFQWRDSGQMISASYGKNKLQIQQARQWADKRVGEIVAGFIREPANELLVNPRSNDTKDPSR